jgi:hypothetical protein
MTIWQAGYNWRDAEGVARWSPTYGEPLFTDQNDADKACCGHPDGESRPVTVFENTQEWLRARKATARAGAIAKVKQAGLTPEEMEALGL